MELMVGCIRWVEDLNCNSEQHCFDKSMSESEDPYNYNEKMIHGLRMA